VCWNPCSSCCSLHLLREEFLSSPIHSPHFGLPYRSFTAGHRVPRTKPTCLLHTGRPHRPRPFALVLHLHQHQSSRNLHLPHLAKNYSTQHCQSLITPGSDHPPVLEPHMVLNLPLMSALTTPTYSNTSEKKKKINE
jgi:hypothetical protein